MKLGSSEISKIYLGADAISKVYKGTVPVDIYTYQTTYNLDVPNGWLVPTADEWEAERLSWSSNDRDGAFASPLKLTAGGLRATSGGVAFTGSIGLYATQSISTTDVSYFGIDSVSAEISVESRGFGSSIRLIKQTGLPLVSGDQTFTYNGASWTYREVESNGRIWMDRNLGASQVATAYNDSLAYGDLFQWGRNIDGHQVRTSGTTNTLSNSDTPGHGDFIVTSVAPNDWRDPQNDDLWQPI
jgi:hypothetical protein